VICNRSGSDRHGNCEDGENADSDRRRGRRQIAPVVVLGVNVFGGRGRRRRPKLVKGVDGSLLVDEFVWRWRRKILEDLRLKVRRRLERRGKEEETPARVGDMRPSRIDLQICPIRAGRILGDRAPPKRRFSSDC